MHILVKNGFIFYVMKSISLEIKAIKAGHDIKVYTEVFKSFLQQKSVSTTLKQGHLGGSVS